MEYLYEATEAPLIGISAYAITFWAASETQSSLNPVVAMLNRGSFHKGFKRCFFYAYYYCFRGTNALLLFTLR